MSDERRDAVAKALFDESPMADNCDWDTYKRRAPSVTEVIYRNADAAIAALTAAEPTDAEVEAALRVYDETLDSCRDDYTTPQQNRFYAMRITLYAARKAGQP
jgi:hypothetical protein